MMLCGMGACGVPDCSFDVVVMSAGWGQGDGRQCIRMIELRHVPVLITARRRGRPRGGMAVVCQEQEEVRRSGRWGANRSIQVVQGKLMAEHGGSCAILVMGSACEIAYVLVHEQRLVGAMRGCHAAGGESGASWGHRVMVSASADA